METRVTRFVICSVTSLLHIIQNFLTFGKGSEYALPGGNSAKVKYFGKNTHKKKIRFLPSGPSLSVSFPTDGFPVRPRCMVRKTMLLSIVWLWNFSVWGKAGYISYSLVWNMNIITWLYFVHRSAIVFFREMRSCSWGKLQLEIYLRTFPIPCIFIYLFNFKFYFIHFSGSRLQFVVNIFFLSNKLFYYEYLQFLNCTFDHLPNLIRSFLCHVNWNSKTTWKKTTQATKPREITNTSFDAL